MKCDFDVTSFIKKLVGRQLNLETLKELARDEAVLYFINHQEEFAKYCKTEIQKENFIKMLEEKILQATVVHLMEGKK